MGCERNYFLEKLIEKGVDVNCRNVMVKSFNYN